MDRGELIQEMGRTRLVAVVRSKSAEEALATAKAVAEGGVQFIEITFSVPSALDVIEVLVAEGRLHVGAGTVLANEEAEEAIGTGAQFIVSPSLELNLIPICHDANVPCIPGAATPTEILAAARAKARPSWPGIPPRRLRSGDGILSPLSASSTSPVAQDPGSDARSPRGGCD